MRIATGRVVGGKIIVDGEPFAEGSVVTVVAQDDDEAFDASGEASAAGVVSLTERITVDPGQCGGRPCIRGMRIRVTDVLDLLVSGLTAEEVLLELPDLEPRGYSGLPPLRGR